MEKKYKFESVLSPHMSNPPIANQIAALQVGLVSLVNALEKRESGFGDEFLKQLDISFEINEGTTSQIAIAQLGSMVKIGLTQVR